MLFIIKEIHCFFLFLYSFAIAELLKEKKED